MHATDRCQNRKPDGRVCSWVYDPGQDLYCSGCGARLFGLTVSPPAGSTMPVFPNDSRQDITLTNQGQVQVRVEGLDCPWLSQSEPAVPLDLPPGGEPVTLTLSLEPPSEAGKMAELHLRLSNETLTYILETRPLPEIEISLAPSAQGFRSGVWFLDRHDPEIRGAVVCSDELELTSPLVVEEGSGFSLVDGPAQGQAGREHPFSLLRGSLPGGQDLDRELVLKARFGKLGPRELSCQVRFYAPAKLVLEPDQAFKGSNAVVRGASFAAPLRLWLYNYNRGQCSAARVVEVRSEPWLVLDPAQAESLRDAILESDGKEHASDFSRALDFKVVPELLPPPSDLDSQTYILEPRWEVVWEDLTTGQTRSKLYIRDVEVREPRRLDLPVAVDFGTSNTCLAYVDPDDDTIVCSKLDYRTYTGVPSQMILTGQPPDTPQLASCIFFRNFEDDHQGRETGAWSREHRFINDHSFNATAWGFKRRLWHNLPQPFVDDSWKMKYFTPQQLTTLVLREVQRRYTSLRAQLPGPVVVLTVPAAFGLEEREKVRQAAAEAGFDEDSLDICITEPEALALHFVVDRDLREGQQEVFGVFDFGGGTTDISICRYRLKDGMRHLEVLASHGAEQLGGNLLSHTLARLLYEKAMEGQPEEMRPSFLFPEHLDREPEWSKQERRVYRPFLERAEIIKEDRNGSRTRLYEEGQLDLEGIQVRDEAGNAAWLGIPGTLTKQEFEEALTPLIEKGLNRVIHLVRRLHTLGELQEARLDYFILSGNSSRLPLVQQLAIGGDWVWKGDSVIFEEGMAKEGVALGACRYAILQSEFSPSLKVSGVLRLPYSLGILSLQSFVPQLRAYQPITTDHPPTFLSEWRPVGKDMFDVKIYENRDLDQPEEGAKRVPAQKLRKVFLVGHIPIPDELRPARGQEPQWEVRYSLQATIRGLRYSLWARGLTGDKENPLALDERLKKAS